MSTMYRGVTALTLALAAGMPLHASAQVTPNAGMIRWPDVSKDSICFVYANDIWIVPKAGGMASPLASPPGVEQFPRFSPDGKSIAFVGNYDGNRDLYTMSVAGGVPHRVTYHPAAETLSDWTPDGGLLYITNGYSGLARQTQLWKVGAAGGMPTKLPVPYGGFGSISPDGKWLTYTLHSTDTRTWKRYRGGMATDVWLFNLDDKTSKRLTDWEGTDTIPMFVPGGDGKTVYYLSDQGPEHRLNVWACDVASGKREQVTTFKDDDVRWPGVGPGSDGKGEIVFQLGSKLMLLNLGSRQAAEVKVTIPGDRPRLRPHTVDEARNLEDATLSPSGKRVVVEARGDLWSAPVKEGVVRALTRTDGVAERSPAWSPDGKWIAYFSDESGDYELYVRPSDAKPPEKKDEKKDDKKDEAKAEPKPEAKAQAPRKLSSHGHGYLLSPVWSPDSAWIQYTDEAGRLLLANVESGETKELDKDPWGNQLNVSWSSDSQWIAYSRNDNASNSGVIWIANVKTGEKKAVTSPMFGSFSPAFDRKGDWLFFASQRAVNNPEYSDVDNTYAYTRSTVLLMLPLRADVKSPWLPESAEETLKDDAKKDAKKDEAKKDEAKKEEPKKDGAGDAPAAASEDALSGTWSGSVSGPAVPGGSIAVTFKFTLKDGAISGSVTSPMGEGALTGTFDKASGAVELTVQMHQQAFTFKGTLKGGELSGTWAGPDGNGGAFTASKGGEGGGAKGDAKSDEKAKEVKIDFEGIERRAIQLPVAPGGFGGLAVADGEKLMFVRTASRNAGDAPTIKIYGYKDDDKEEKTVTVAGGYQLSADGKKALVFRGGANLSVIDASAGGGKSQSVITSGMTKTIEDPRVEWKHIVNEAWRLERDFFYEPTMHGVDWPKVRDHYLAMVDDAASREDVNWIISEMISELNIGHAYLTGPGDVEDQPNVNVGMLGCDLTLDTTGPVPAYKIARIVEGGPWDSDARGPLSQPGVDVKAGEYLLAVNGLALDTTKDPAAAFLGMADKTVAITVCAKPVRDGTERDIVIRLIGSEGNLRYRDYIEAKRKYVEEKSGGKVGYIYVPNTGVDGQNDLYRQFFGQRGKEALIIDERWNGGGQIPNRFIELLSRPNTNFWARRNGNDWPWDPDAHFGPKCMLINGLAGSGGDMFPWLFKHHKVGPVIGTRTWGGLVGISGVPHMIDGGAVSVPNFGFYETDGTWGVEGHGVDPDVEIIDDPAKMQNGGDPQLDKAIEMMLQAVKEHPYTKPQRPKSPDRSGMGIKPEDK